ncbi:MULTISPECIES: hypothetical protein [Nocardioides]|uniref:Uncharacterized protein n=1 Tax=Nocardioides abyssi TaxID=3058370 RepID=A0ABT8EUP2_9ACTN|nr:MULTISPECIES: hypothetical protein [Nocardioides]MDN4161895.1 hypothetical protein [Nocardioides abyssi]WKN46629.1 hypothetical protein OSR43_11265 [Nocardioides sp. Arc9.136]
MSPAWSPARRRPWTLALASRGLVLFAALAGLFAMHGLSDHAPGVGRCASPAALLASTTLIGPGAGHVDGDADAPQAASGPAAVLASDLHASAAGPVIAATEATEVAAQQAAQAVTQAAATFAALFAAAVDLPSVSDNGGHDNGLAGLCLAVLAAALAALLLAVRVSRRWWRLTRRQFAALVAAVAELGARVRVPDGPTSASLCVFRC